MEIQVQTNAATKEATVTFRTPDGRMSIATGTTAHLRECVERWCEKLATITQPGAVQDFRAEMSRVINAVEEEFAQEGEQ